MVSKKIVTPHFKYKRATPAKLDGGVWGAIAVRKATTEAQSSRLLAYRACIASERKGKKYASIGESQRAFAEIAHKCKAKV
ncbi:MAG: hypothetical protein ACTSX6_00390 [Candidatus Heimdallarchaeaceae archaeon]